MSLFFDAAWFDEKLAARGKNRADLAACAGLERADLHRIFTHQREPLAPELEAFAAMLGADLVEVTLRSGVARPQPEGEGATAARIESIEARLDALDSWLEEFERTTKKSA